MFNACSQVFFLFVVNFSGVGGNPWNMDKSIKHKLRNVSLSLLEEDNDIYEAGVVTPAKAAKEAAKEELIVNAARAKMAEFASRAQLGAAPVPGAYAPAVGGSPPPTQAFAPQDSSPAPTPSAPAPGP